jgi:uroporphyrinogen decarboxylase
MPLDGRKQEKRGALDRLDDLLHYRLPDRVPMGSMSTGFNAVNSGYTVREVLEEPKKCFDATLWTAEMFGWEPMPQFPGHSVWGAIDFGGTYRLPEGEYEGALIIKTHPVETETDLDTLNLPDPRRAGRIPYAMQFATLQAQHGLPVFFSSRSPFTMAANICGLERFCRWMIRSPELCHGLIKMALTHTTNVLAVWAETFGAENLIVWMSNPSESNQVISPRHMERFALPYHVLYHQRLRELGVKRFGFHICGDQNRNLSTLADTSPWPHPSILSFGHEVAISSAAKAFPNDIIFGNIEPNLFQVGSPNQIYETCRGIIMEGKRVSGGFIMAPGCGVPATAPPVKVYAMTRAVLDFGSHGTI